MGEPHFSSLSPRLPGNLLRCAPHLYRQIDDIKATNIPQGLAPILQPGVAEGLHEPARLECLQLDAGTAFRKAIDLFPGGILTPASCTRLRTLRESN
ncbi:hypothetical protein D0B32_03285 [Paraburkholderia sp. DHOC27]|nr:hypothetical protein D0B32_03285 [Paraburkholderia sp. DHOC27]